MKSINQQSIAKNRTMLAYLKSSAPVFTAFALAALPSPSQAQSTWNGSSSTDWNTAANWSAGVPNGGDAFISTTSPNIATISNNFITTPVDIKVGWTGSGRLDHISGNASTGDGNWMWLGIVGNQVTYNFADTRTNGGTFTGCGQGSGNLNVGGGLQNGNILLGLDDGTVSTLNVNSSGTINGAGLFAGANGGANGIVNIDSGTLNFSGEVQIGAYFFNQGSGVDNQLNISGGTLTADIISFARGANNGASMKGTANITGGMVNSKRWFTLGFAGSASDTAAVTNSGGTINVNTVGEGVLEMGVFDATVNYFTVNSGSVTLQNNASISFGQGGNHSGTSAFTQNGGTVTFYSDSGSTIGGTGSLNLGNGGSTGTYTYDLNGGTLTVPKIQKTAVGASATFNFNGGTLKAVANNGSFLNLGAGSAAANVRNGGAIIDTVGFNVTISQGLQHSAIAGDNATDGGLTKLGNGTLTLSGANTYNGNTTVSGGTLELVQATFATDSAISISNGAQLKLDFAGNNQIGALTLNGVSQPSGVYNNLTSPTYITGTGGLVVGSIATNPTNVAFSVSGSTMALSWPADHLGWTLYSNSVGLTAVNQWFPVPGSSTVTSTNLTVSPSQANVFFRLQLQ